mmetsp:Transcript_44478/g.32596  ORF Transcript_44478/g.32596 Transcript_44478/m.32596 type:complete len:101 (+) Transcript_44478:715-1017(+)
MMYNETDYVTIDAYDQLNGIAYLYKQVWGRHYGYYKTTASDYNGVDIRAEVFLASRNIKISGNDTEGWGCQIVTSDFEEANGVWRAGMTILENVEIYNCS